MDGEVLETETFLYRHFDGGGVLLYVGVSLNAVTRLAAHYDGSHWSRLIRRVEVEVFGTRGEALAAERRAIKGEGPAHNIQHRAGVEREERAEAFARALESRRDYVQRLVTFKVIYSVIEVAELLGMSTTRGAVGDF